MGSIVYNVTVKVDRDIVRKWIKWMREEHIPDVLATGCFLDATIFRLRYPREDEGVTYAIQYRCADMQSLERYHSEYAAALQQEHADLFADKFAAFRTILEQVDQIGG